jgi:hypothetical protein
MYKRTVKKEILLFCILLSHSLSLFPSERTITLGSEDHWNSIFIMDSINIEEGKRGNPDIVLRHGEYSADKDTDLLLHFNQLPPMDKANSYKIEKQDMTITEHNAFLGSGAGVFIGPESRISLAPSGDSLFAPNAEWKDFSIEFWLYPTTLDENEMLLFWRGSRWLGSISIPQSFSCRLVSRTIRWDFDNIFLPPSGEPYYLHLESPKQLIPRQWHHHLLRYDSETGLLEYLMDGIPEDIQYTSLSGSEEPVVYSPRIGDSSSSRLILSEAFTGIIDELRFSKRFVEFPQLYKYNEKPGTVLTNTLDLGYTGSELESITADYNTPSDSAVFFYFRLSNDVFPAGLKSPDWVPFIPGTSSLDLLQQKTARYVQLKIELYPNGLLDKSPSISEINVSYKPDLPPRPPTHISIEPGNNSAVLYWERVSEPDIAGYLIYYGDKPGQYFGEDGKQGISPIDAGNVNSFRIEGLENGKLYYFAISSYDASRELLENPFSREVNVRPSAIYKER